MTALTDVYTALRTLLLTLVPGGTEVVQGLGNRVPMPSGAFVSMTHMGQKRLATNIHTVDTIAGTQTAMASVQLNVQLDFYGPLSGGWAASAVIVLRDYIGCDALRPYAQPLYADEARQMELVTGEEQYLQRWRVDAALEYHPSVTQSQQFADVLGPVDLIEVDEAYPP